MKRRWYWSLGIERWSGGYQVGFGLITVQRIWDLPHPVTYWWWNLD